MGAGQTIAFNQPSARVFQIGTFCKLRNGARLVRCAWTAAQGR
ncbi:hypothetical protein [Paraburkholderia panacisoli]|jgi:hypothetical protein|nr:hypothetical protein [Paraburkholderia panacisoli]